MKHKKPYKQTAKKHSSAPVKPKSAKPKEQKSKTAKPRAPKLKLHLFGQHAVAAAWLNPKRHIHALYGTETALKQFEETLRAGKSLKRPDPVIVEKETLERALPPGTVHQGLGLNCQALDEVSLKDILIEQEGEQSALIVMLDQVTDPHNVGAILRSACAFGAAALIMQSKHAPELSGILAKTACGAAEHVPVAYETNLSRSLEQLKEAGYFVYGLDERGEDLGAVNSAGKNVLVLGAEGPGLRRLVKEQCDQLLKLPTSGPISSLNVSNAAAVALYAFSK